MYTVQPCTAFHSHAQSCTAMFILVQPCTSLCNHVQQWTASHPCTALYSLVKPLYIHVQYSHVQLTHIDEKLCYFFMVNPSSLLTLIFTEIAWGSFLLLKLNLLIYNFIKKRPEGAPKSQYNCFDFGHNSQNYTWLQKGEYLLYRNSDRYEIWNLSS